MIDTAYYNERVQIMEQAYGKMQEMPSAGMNYQTFQGVCLEAFDAVLEHSGKLLRKCMRTWFHSSKAADELTFKDVFRHAAHRNLIGLEEAERWLIYRDGTKHECDEKIAEAIVPLLPDVIRDAKALEKIIVECADD